MDLKEASTAGWLVEATVSRLQAAMSAGDLTSREIVEGYLLRIAEFNKSGPGLNAILEVNPEALQIAEGLDAERARKGPRGPLHGIPVLLKDNVDTGDKMHTSAGSIALAESRAARDAFVARRLRQAGAVILGKANMTEWANFMTENMPNGYSSRGGQVRNPYADGNLDPGGSSSGSAVATAGNLTAVAVGTETSGSILNPATRNSIVGIKPTVGLVSRTGIIPIANSQDTAGPMGRTVADAAALLGAMAGEDEEDPATRASVGRTVEDYTAFLDPGGLKGRRIGVPAGRYELKDPELLPLFEAAVAVMRQAGAEVVTGVALDPDEAEWDYQVLLYEFKPNLNAYLDRLDPRVPVHSMRELIEFNERHAEVALRHGQTLLIASEATSGTLTEKVYIHSRLRDRRQCRTNGIDRALREHRLDALLFPGSSGAGIAAKAGYPSIAVPAGYTASGVPFGVMFTAGAFEEPLLIRLGYAFEWRTRHRRVPPWDRAERPSWGTRAGHEMAAASAGVQRPEGGAPGSRAGRMEERVDPPARPIVRIAGVKQWEGFLAAVRESGADDMFTFYQRSHRGGLYGKYLRTVGEEGVQVLLPNGAEEIVGFPLRVKHGRFYD